MKFKNKRLPIWNIDLEKNKQKISFLLMFLVFIFRLFLHKTFCFPDFKLWVLFAFFAINFYTKKEAAAKKICGNEHLVC